MSAVAKSTETARPLAALIVTVKLANTVPTLPSVTVTLLMLSDGNGSLSVIVPRPCPSAIVAFDGFVRLTKYVSFASSSRSPLTGTVICFEVWPGVNVSVPEPAV